MQWRWAAAIVVVGVLEAGRADAFTGVFLAESDRSTQVIEHRVAVSARPDATVLWDQARWTGNPTTLAWVAPVRRGAEVTLTSDAWLASLDASTQPVVYQPPVFGAAAGCSLAGCARDTAFDTGPDKIGVRPFAVAAPAETLTISGSDRGALARWLSSNGFAVPDAARAAVDAYEAEGFDFVVMRLSPNCGERTTRTIRVVSPGAPPTVPIRMMRVGAGRALPLKLFVLSTRRQAVGGFGTTTIPLDRLVWDERDEESNYEDLLEAALGSGSGTQTFLTEYAGVQDRVAVSGRRTVTPSFYALYPALCGRDPLPSRTELLPTDPVTLGPCAPPGSRRDSGADADLDAAGDAETEGGASDAGDDASADAASDASPGAEDAGDDGGGGEPPDASVVPPSEDSCATPDDLDVALAGFDLDSVTLTRMRGSLAGSTFDAAALSIVPAPTSEGVTNGLQAIDFADDEKRDRPNRTAACASAEGRGRATVVPLLAIGALALALARRRRRR